MNESLPPLPRKVPLSAQISEQLREGIAQGVWPLGSRIPGELELAERFGTSRNTVREALRSLVHAGLLEARPGDGTYVRAGSELQVALQRRADQEQLDHVFGVREALERYGARQAAVSATPELLARLTETLRARDAAVEPATYLARDLEFHLQVISASGNPLLIDLFGDLHRDSTVQPARIGCADWAATVDEHWGTADPHWALLGALEQRDPAAAEEAVTALIRIANQFARAAERSERERPEPGPRDTGSRDPGPRDPLTGPHAAPPHASPPHGS